MRSVRIEVNGQAITADVEPRLLLVNFIRDVAGLTGTNIGCDTSHCGACTVLVDGRSTKSCTVLAVSADGASVSTIEGLSDGDEPHPLQRSFVENYGLQCGYCTPGMIMQAAWLLERDPQPSDEAIREAIEGNLCRCTGYSTIVDAVRQAAADLDTPG
jgi:carbon-monoxide dehydrogenase small subunit